MNFLAHSLLVMRLQPSTGLAPAYVVGNALPDLLPLAAPRKRLRLSVLADAPALTAEERAIGEGARVHLLTDAAFHNTAAFQAAQAQVGELIGQAGFVGIRVRRFFLSHVLVELALDAVLLRGQPGLADGFYDAFVATDFFAVSRWTEQTVGQPLPLLPGVLMRFSRSQYLRHYATAEGVAEGLRRLLLRARQDVIEGDNRVRLVGLVSRAMAVVDEQAGALLDETEARVALLFHP